MHVPVVLGNGAGEGVGALLEVRDEIGRGGDVVQRVHGGGVDGGAGRVGEPREAEAGVVEVLGQFEIVNGLEAELGVFGVLLDEIL